MTNMAMTALVVVAAFGAEATEQGVEEKDYGVFAVSGLECVIGNNKALGGHRAWYNGVYSITAPGQAQSPFVPLYAGLNLENFFDAQPRSPAPEIFFEPRSAPMQFKRLSPTSAELYQPETPVYGIESWTIFELKEPHYIDFAFRCVPRKDVFKGGFFGVFWASYIDAPLNKSMYFLGPGASIENPFWMQYLTQKHDRDSTVRHENDPAVTNFEPGELLWNQISPLTYSEPFFYGQFQNMVLIYIFEPNPLIRFSHSPSGGGKTAAGDGANPAWDFQLITPNYKVGEEYGLRGRFVYKLWVDRADVLKEVKKYLDEVGAG